MIGWAILMLFNRLFMTVHLHAHKAARELVEYLHSKYATPKRVGLQFKWEGALVHLRDQYPSVELQHEILKEWND
jgi:hypothetical protein